MNFFTRKRKEQMQKGKPVIQKRITTIEFIIDGKFYTYKYTATRAVGQAYVYHDGNIIYGPYSADCTQEGLKVYELILKNEFNFG